MEKPPLTLKPLAVSLLLRSYNGRGWRKGIANAVFKRWRIEVAGPITLPKGTVAIPKGMAFLGDLTASGCALAEFDHKVMGDAAFSDMQSFKQVGQKAVFQGHVTFRNVGIESFAGRTGGSSLCIFDGCKSLRSIDRDARLGCGIEMRGSSLRTFAGSVACGVSLERALFLDCTGPFAVLPEAVFDCNLLASASELESFRGTVEGTVSFE